MKNEIVLLLVLVMIMSIAFVGCGSKEKVDEALIAENPESQEQVQDSEPTPNVSNALADRAKEEGVSASEMESMIKELATKTAENYGDTYENYVASLELEGKTPFDEFSAAADYMGITIKEYYEFEMSKPEMSDEDKATMEGMNNAIKELEGIDLGELEEQANQLEENANAMENAGSVETTGDVLEIINFEVLEVMNEENAAGLGFYGIEYTSEKEVADVLAHFNDYLKGTENYFITDSSPGGAIVSGTVNGVQLDMSCERDFDNKITYIAIMYNAEIIKK